MTGAFMMDHRGLRRDASRIIRGNMRISEVRLKRQELAIHPRNQLEQPLIWGFRTEKTEQVRSLDQSCYPAVTCTNTKEALPPLLPGHAHPSVIVIFVFFVAIVVVVVDALKLFVRVALDFR